MRDKKVKDAFYLVTLGQARELNLTALAKLVVRSPVLSISSVSSHFHLGVRVFVCVAVSVCLFFSTSLIV